VPCERDGIRGTGCAILLSPTFVNSNGKEDRRGDAGRRVIEA
jgi:hypothetical protein